MAPLLDLQVASELAQLAVRWPLQLLLWPAASAEEHYWSNLPGLLSEPPKRGRKTGATPKMSKFGAKKSLSAGNSLINLVRRRLAN